MRRPRNAAAAVAAVVLLVLALAATAMAGSQAKTKLVGVVGQNDAFKISLTNKGKTVKTLKAGTYTFVIQDGSTIHNYELNGPNGKTWEFTSVGFKGTKSITIKLAKGKYTAVCEPHASFMFQHFTVV
jgi:plastocyanin